MTRTSLGVAFCLAFMVVFCGSPLGAQEPLGRPGSARVGAPASKPGLGAGMRLEVDPRSGKVRAGVPRASFTPGDVQTGTVNGSFDFISAVCTDCSGVCPTFERNVVVVLEANAAVSNYGIGGASTGNYSLSSVGESGNDPIAAGEQFMITFTGDVLSCSSIFSVFFDVCSPPNPGSPTAACAPDELQVNAYTTSSQSDPAVAMADDGSFVVAWTSYGSPGNDIFGESIQARRFTSSGLPAGAQFQVNSATFGTQYRSAAAIDADGDFVVAWSSDFSFGSDNSGGSVQAQRFDSTGTALGSEIQVNTYTTDRQSFSSVSAAPGGGFVVTWASDGGSAGNDSHYASVQLQRYASDGSALGGELQVNTYTTANQFYPSVAVAADGDFVVVWESLGSSGSDTSSCSVQAQRYASDGSTLGGELQVNAYTTSSQGNPSVTVDSGGDFVVVWQGSGSAGSDTSGPSIQARRFASDGTALGGDFQVNTYTTGFQGRAWVAADSAGNFVVTWESSGSGGSDSSSTSVQGQVFASDGTAVGGEFQVNTYTYLTQGFSQVAADPAGDFVVVWDSFGSDGDDTSQVSVQRQLFFGPLQ